MLLVSTTPIAKPQATSAKNTVRQELETARQPSPKLLEQLDTLRKLLAASKKWLGLETDPFREALACSLENPESCEACQ